VAGGKRDAEPAEERQRPDAEREHEVPPGCLLCRALDHVYADCKDFDAHNEEQQVLCLEAHTENEKNSECMGRRVVSVT